MRINNRKRVNMCNYFFFFFLCDFIMVVVFSTTVRFDNTRNFLLLFMGAINHLLRDCQSWKIKAFAHVERLLPFPEKVGVTFLFSTWFLTRRRWWTNTSLADEKMFPCCVQFVKIHKNFFLRFSINFFTTSEFTIG